MWMLTNVEFIMLTIQVITNKYLSELLIVEVANYTTNVSL